jgi:dTDP-4-dehydrorhamnose reductase/SAM-dependent methyltransferase
MKVLILGASGIIAQHMRLCTPDGIHPIWIRRLADPITRGIDLESNGQPDAILNELKPDVVINFAGESRVDVVEREPDRYMRINVGIPVRIAAWCGLHDARMIQISSQAVHHGDRAPYGPVESKASKPVNHYGRQKAIAELSCINATILRLTFILGIRPLKPQVRENPLEAMIAGQTPQVSNRWFSPLMAWDAARLVWKEVTSPSSARIQQFGVSRRMSRFDIAQLVNPDVLACRHEDFRGLAPRPIDTTFAPCISTESIEDGIKNALRLAQADRATEIALFLGITLEDAMEVLARGFGPLHNDVSDDFRACNPQGDEALLGWYRRTISYIWELSAYHEDPGFNYCGMCSGIVTRLKHEGARRVLCLGDGIGDLTLSMIRAGLKPVYHDLLASRTSEYALFRIWRQTGAYPAHHMSTDWRPPQLIPPYDAVVSLDFLEHVTDVECWVRAAYAALKPGGLFVAQNAFACGSGAEGAMPMHLAVNDRYEKDWDPLLTAVGFEQMGPQWYRRK